MKPGCHTVLGLVAALALQALLWEPAVGFLTPRFPPLPKDQQQQPDEVITATAVSSIQNFFMPARGGVVRDLTRSRSLQANIRDLAIATVIGFATDPLVVLIFNTTHLTSENNNVKATFAYGAADSLSNGARAWAMVLVVEVLQDWLGIQFPFTQNVDLSVAAPQIGFIIWISQSCSTIKRTIFQRYVKGDTLGRVALYDKWIDLLIGTLTTANVLQILKIDLNMGIQSLFAASGVSALVFSLASKGLVENIVAGFIIQAWDAIEEGEEVKLGDGTEGTVTSIGLVETEILGGDNIGVRIPNSQLTGQRVSNLSRLTRSQVKQVLRFKYQDMDNIPACLEEIMKEIKGACPKLILDGSKPFQAIITAYEPDHVQAVINCHFEISPSSSEYAMTKQAVLLAIAKAMKHNKMEFAIPSIYYKTAGDS